MSSNMIPYWYGDEALPPEVETDIVSALASTRRWSRHSSHRSQTMLKA